MRFFSKFFLAIIAFSLLLPSTAYMADTFGFEDSAPSVLKKGIAGSTSVQGVVGNLIGVALSMIGIIFFLILVYAGFNWMIARGNTEQVDKSKSMIEGAVIGLIIVLAAYAITRFVFESLETGGTTPTQTSNICDAQSVAPCGGKEAGSVCVAGSTICKFSNDDQTRPNKCTCQ